jgi:hypothetical protein
LANSSNNDKARDNDWTCVPGTLVFAARSGVILTSGFFVSWRIPSTTSEPFS